MKYWWRSKTIWFNTVAALVAIMGYVDANILHAIGVTDTSRWLAVIGFITTVFNVVNRFSITKPIRRPKKTRP